MRFVLFCEGATETKALPAFFRRWLNRRLSQRVGISPVGFRGWRHLYDEVRRKADLRLQDNDVIAVISLLDLYGPTFYPERKTSADERYDWAKRHVEGKVGSDRFVQFFAVHEVEAWLLSDPKLFPENIRSSLPGRIINPETVNFDEPPARLLDRLYREKTNRSYKKVTQGKQLFDKLDVDIARGKCPRLAEMLDTMLFLAQRAGLS